ncbi:MAG: beta-ketoacyl-[acyl-carrier-protein] synthase II [Candidatus Wallbacteria bacterium HGW-Wallbacteria-1]|jgi:3-oxoacyl-[acyl-carrier-protein] synthase II|uniref:Beta-ketoacyl-[acyl-carrier-protein] synthase II n=1 Tax=Candidatus Wallbacteria bacterium HGW-Wallbacteria-1 TaxID=2013854 RepID=A0A2N1PU38_9BACT|nr:MAG: beta-ketoacyl-[acyl-carrier-protein] synthase II [Candidatus Wallbacteria bacterium HGW-Wallbacteria-1]
MKSGKDIDRVVITSVGVVSPNGIGFNAFSHSLREGQSGLGEIDLFDAGNMTSRIVGQIRDDDIECSGIASEVYRVFPGLKSQSDRKLLLGAMAFLEAVRDLEDRYLRESAIVLGTSLESFCISKLFELSPGNFDIDTYAGNLMDGQERTLLQAPLDFLGREITRKFHLSGPNLVNCSACTASTQAIGHSFQMIRSGRCRRVIAGGTDSMLNPLGLGGFSVLGALSTRNDLGAKAICPFDLWREGTVLGEGAAIIVMESLETATERGAPILAEILGYASTFDAYKLSEPDPQGRGISMAMRRAIAMSGSDVNNVDYISAHGTGTLLNDKMETAAIKGLFGERAYEIPVSSIKSMIGHLIGASGAVEVAAILCMMRDDFIAPTVNLEHPDPECDLDYVANVMRPARLNMCLKNSMGFGGQNAALVLGRFEQ